MSISIVSLTDIPQSYAAVTSLGSIQKTISLNQGETTTASWRIMHGFSEDTAISFLVEGDGAKFVTLSETSTTIPPEETYSLSLDIATPNNAAGGKYDVKVYALQEGAAQGTGVRSSFSIVVSDGTSPAGSNQKSSQTTTEPKTKSNPSSQTTTTPKDKDTSQQTSTTPTKSNPTDEISTDPRGSAKTQTTETSPKSASKQDTASSQATSAGSSSTTSSSGSSSGRSGGGSSGGGGGSTRTNVDVSGTDLTLYEVSWNCDDNITTVITNDGPVDVMIFGINGKINLEAAENQDLKDRKIFTASYYDKLMSLRVSAIDGRGFVSISETVRPDVCVGSKVFAEYTDSTTRPKVLTPTTTDTTQLASFVDPNKDPYDYVKRYVTEPSYKDWFDGSFPQYDGICDAVGLPSNCIEQYDHMTNNKTPAAEKPDNNPVPDPEPTEPECGLGTELVNGICKVIAVPEPKDDDEGGGCLIATAAYNSELAPQVQELREIRDGKLMQTSSGTSFMAIFNGVYYSFSPYISDYQRENPVFNDMVRASITPMLYTLNIMSMADDDASVILLGTLVLLLNGMIYAGIPTASIIAIRKRL